MESTNPRSLILCDSLQFGRKVWCDAQEQSSYFFFANKKNRDGSIYVKCKESNNANVLCPVRGKISGSGEVIAMRGVHNHQAEFGGYGLEWRTARGNWLRALRADPQQSPTEAVLVQRRQLPQACAVLITPTSHLPTARRIAASMRPSKVRSLRELHSAIIDLDLPGFTRTADGERLLSFYCEGNDSLIITTRRQLDLLQSATLVQADATYKIAPRNLCRQIFTVHGNWDGYTGMVACVFMNSESAEGYGEVFRQMKQALPTWSMTAYMGDFDAAMRSAVAAEFSNARLYGCLYHYAQCLVKHASSPAVGLARQLRRPGVVLREFLNFSALPLVPATQISSTFEILADDALRTTDSFAPFVSYIRRYWLQIIGPSQLSVYRAPCRTNNAVESSNAYLRRHLNAHGPIWNVVSLFARIAQDVPTDVEITAGGASNVRSRPNRCTRQNDLKIKRSWDLLDQNVLTPLEFIRHVKFRVGRASLRHGLQTIELEDDLVRVLEPWLALHDHTYDEEAKPQHLLEHNYSAPGE